MPQSLTRVCIHITFSTKNRVGFLDSAGICKEMHAYIAFILKAYDSPAIIVGGTIDHTYILCTLSETHTLAEVNGWFSELVEEEGGQDSKGRSADHVWHVGAGGLKLSREVGAFAKWQLTSPQPPVPCVVRLQSAPPLLTNRQRSCKSEKLRRENFS